MSMKKNWRWTWDSPGKYKWTLIDENAQTKVKKHDIKNFLKIG